MVRLFLTLLVLILPFRLAGGQESAPAYLRPDLEAGLFDALSVPLAPGGVEGVMRELRFIARNLPPGGGVTPEVRSRALGIALRLRPDDRAAVVANGQLARGITPEPLEGVSATAAETGARLYKLAFPLLSAPEKAGRDLALYLLDLALTLNPELQPRIFEFTYGARPRWPAGHLTPPLLDSPPGFQLLKAEARVVLPGLEKGELRTFTVQAEARPVPGQKGLQLNLPDAMKREMGDPRDLRKKAFREDVERRMEKLRAILRLRHEVWPEGWAVDISFPEAQTRALPQVFTGMALVVDSLLSSEPLEAGGVVAAAGDLEGRMQAVLPLEELLPAAARLETSSVLVMPPESGAQIDDWLLLHREQWPLLYRLTLHRAPTVTDAMALLETGRAPMLERAVNLFAEVAARLRATREPLTELRRPETVADLKQIVLWHPRHLSAAALLSVAAGGNPTLTPAGSLEYIDRLARNVLSTDRKRFPLHVPPPKFQKSDFGKSGDALQAAMKLLHPSVQPYAQQVLSLARMLDRSAGRWKLADINKGQPDPPEVKIQRERTAKARPEVTD